MLNWLHFSDLHFGMSGQGNLWPNIREAFFEDLQKLSERCGPWDVVFFTGDLVQQGRKEEFDELEKKFFRPLWHHFAALGKEPLLLAVPGNHDLVRPDGRKPGPALKWLLKPDQFSEIADDLFDGDGGQYRSVIDGAFANYRDWWHVRAGLLGIPIQHGVLPGDFSATLEDGKHRIGVVGLNATFLQLAGGHYEGKLAWDVRQFHGACGGDGPVWVRDHDVNLLLTHQGPRWLTKASSTAVLNEINPAGRFAAHLFGHQHELETESRALNGGKSRNLWQGASLFGMEKFGEPPATDRRHGYSAGRLEIGASEATIRLWPRSATFDANGWRFIPDHAGCVLESDDGTSPLVVPVNARQAPANRKKRVIAPASTHAVKLDAYVAALLRACDIINLAGLPEADRNLAMERFLLRNLYVPLRVRVDIAATQSVDDAGLERIEARRMQTRLHAAGRGAAASDREDAEPVGARLQATSKKQSSRKKSKRPAPTTKATTKRLVVLGDPGGGKTTLLRWIATAYLLRWSRDEQRKQLPDADSLPDEQWCPILVRCRELDQERLRTCALPDLLRQAVRRLDIPATTDTQDEIAEQLRQLLIDGKAILLVDGLDEITDPALRAQFCEQLDVIALQYERAPMVVTSRIVGYREMHRRLTQGFEHTTLADLTKEDKDQFVDRWCDVTEPPDRRPSAKEELRTAIHSSDRIERLTGNPMLLTTLALVKRKVGKLPTRRHELYREAVDVLLNWRTEIGERLEREEVLPQLQYLAHAMCRDGKQQLRRDEVLAFLQAMRGEYPNITPIHRRPPEDFLKILQSRTSLLAEMGEKKHNGRMEPVYEFRHLTFQEYLAGLALVEGRYGGHDRNSTLAERIAPLAGLLSEEKTTNDLLVTENWREALRLVVSCCNDDDVDSVLRAILNPRVEEDATRVARPRALLAALCLADEPNVSPSLAEEIFARFAAQLRPTDMSGTAQNAVREIANSASSEQVLQALLNEYLHAAPDARATAGSLCGDALGQLAPKKQADLDAYVRQRLLELSSPAITVVLRAALSIMELAYEERIDGSVKIITAVAKHLDRESIVVATAALALFWLHGGTRGSIKPMDSGVYARVIARLSVETDPHAMMWLIVTLGTSKLVEAATVLPPYLRHESAQLREAAIAALGILCDSLPASDNTEAFVSSVSAILDDDDDDHRRSAVRMLGRRQENGPDRNLLSSDLDGFNPWIDPKEPITAARVRKAQKKLNLPEAEIRARYEALAPTFHLRLAWKES